MLQAKLAKLRRELLEPSTGAGAGGGKGEGQCSTKECQARDFGVAYTMYLAYVPSFDWHVFQTVIIIHFT